ncbi:MAG: DUF1622 domain-containing protein [Acidobacteriaceae bacterium]|nr:DUF1622 domain-containing protein [Acidobacteriaceae bacterium]
MRLTLGRWLAVALEFELAVGILKTAVTPTWTDIEKLAAIAALRTALNYFLEREIQQEASPEQRVAERCGAKERSGVVIARESIEFNSIGDVVDNSVSNSCCRACSPRAYL